MNVGARQEHRSIRVNAGHAAWSSNDRGLLYGRNPASPPVVSDALLATIRRGREPYSSNFCTTALTEVGRKSLIGGP